MKLISNVFAFMFLICVVGIWYFIKKNPDKKLRNYSIVGLIFSMFIVGVTTPINKQENAKPNKQKTELKNDDSSESSTTKNDSKENEKKIKESSEETKSSKVTKESIKESSSANKDKKYASVNKDIEQYLKENQGWATGSIDENAKPIENGTPNPNYANWLYVHSIEYTGKDVEMQVTADFNELSAAEKDNLASSAQGIVMACANLTERPHIYVYNGENSYGGSKILSANEFNWD